MGTDLEKREALAAFAREQMRKEERVAREQHWVTEVLWYQPTHTTAKDQRAFISLKLNEIVDRVGTLGVCEVREILNDLRHDGKIEVVRQSSNVKFKLTPFMQKKIRGEEVEEDA